MDTNSSASTDDGKRFGWPQLLLTVGIAMLITIALTLFLVKLYLFPSEFTPVTLNAKEQAVLSSKLENLDSATPQIDKRSTENQGNRDLAPEAYSEDGASREIHFSEREVNALLANNTDLAKRVAVDLSNDLISAKILMPMDEDFPMLGGRILRIKAGVEFAYKNQRPVVRLKGLSVMGVPMPNAWLGGLKNIDLVEEFGTDEGFWKAFSSGVAAVQVEDGRLMIRLKE